MINGALNAKIVGQSAFTIAQMAGVTVPEQTKILIGEVESVDISEEFAHEKLSPVLAMYHAKDFDEALQKAERLVEDGGLWTHRSAVCPSGTAGENQQTRSCDESLPNFNQHSFLPRRNWRSVQL